MNVAVLGGGDGALGVAADLALAGHGVRLWRPRAEDLGPVREAGGIIRVGERGQERARLERATTELTEAVDGAGVVIVALPAPAQEDMAERLATVLGAQQIALLTPGTFGSYVMARAIARRGGRLPYAFAETGALPCLARKTGPAEIGAPVRAATLPTGVFPAARVAATLDRLRALFPAIQPCRDALDVALTNAGPVVNPPLVLCHAAAIDAGQSPLGIAGPSPTPGVRRLIDAVDRERVSIRARLGFPPPHYEIQASLPAREPEEAVVTFEHRYVAEDVALGLSLLESAGRLAVADTPAISGVLSVFAALLGRDLRAVGRGLDRLGLGDFVRREIDEVLQEGWHSALWRRAWTG